MSDFEGIVSHIVEKPVVHEYRLAGFLDSVAAAVFVFFTLCLPPAIWWVWSTVFGW